MSVKFAANRAIFARDNWLGWAGYLETHEDFNAILLWQGWLWIGCEPGGNELINTYYKEYYDYTNSDVASWMTMTDALWGHETFWMDDLAGEAWCGWHHICSDEKVIL